MREDTPRTMLDVRGSRPARTGERCGENRVGGKVVMKPWVSPRSRVIGERPQDRARCGTMALGRARGLLPVACMGSGRSSPTSGLRPPLTWVRANPHSLRHSIAPVSLTSLRARALSANGDIRNGPMRISSIHNLRA